MTNEEVTTEALSHVNFWQKELRLQDWDIQIEVTSYDPGGAAMVSASDFMGVAKVKIRNPETAPPDSFGSQDLELSVVHELLHIRFPHVNPPQPSLEDKSFEIGIERTAQALVRIRRAAVA